MVPPKDTKEIAVQAFPPDVDPIGESTVHSIGESVGESTGFDDVVSRVYSDESPSI